MQRVEVTFALCLHILYEAHTHNYLSGRVYMHGALRGRLLRSLPNDSEIWMAARMRAMAPMRRGGSFTGILSVNGPCLSMARVLTRDGRFSRISTKFDGNASCKPLGSSYTTQGP